jgi:hypothetical protein
MTTRATGAFGCIGGWVCTRRLEAGERTVAHAALGKDGRLDARELAPAT